MKYFTYTAYSYFFCFALTNQSVLEGKNVSFDTAGPTSVRCDYDYFQDREETIIKSLQAQSRIVDRWVSER